MAEIIRRAELDMVGFDVGDDPVKQGQVALRWRKLTYVDGQLIGTEHHRVVVDVDTNLDTVIGDIEDHLVAMGYDRPPAADLPLIKSITTSIWTDEIRAAVATDRQVKQEQAEEEARQNATLIAAAEAAKVDDFKDMMRLAGVAVPQ